jgi:CoA-transferase family III
MSAPLDRVSGVGAGGAGPRALRRHDAVRPTERLGLGPADCLARNPRLVYGGITGWGQTGPQSQLVGHDINYIALSGTLRMIGRAGHGRRCGAARRADARPSQMVALIGLADDLPEQYDRSSWPVMKERMAAVMRTRTRAEWCEVFDDSNACFAPLLSRTRPPGIRTTWLGVRSRPPAAWCSRPRHQGAAVLPPRSRARPRGPVFTVRSSWPAGGSIAMRSTRCARVAP